MACQARERCAIDQHEQTEQGRQRKCGRHQTRNPVRIRSANELIHQIKVQRPGQRGRSPWHRFLCKPSMKDERKGGEERIESEIPKQQEGRPRRIKMLEMPRVFEREYGNKCDGWRSEEHTSELQSHSDLVCRLL